MSSPHDSILQAAAVPVKADQVCLVTSSSGGRWVVPKGIIDPGRTAAETALQEAYEEAGLVGVLDPEPVGDYTYDKWGGTCHVTVFLMRVTEVLEDWPERAVRQRCWLSPTQALDRITDQALREIIHGALGGGRPTVTMAVTVWIGTSGYIYRHWRGVFYPPDLPARRWFAFYAERFPTVEINNTFYRLPEPETFADWRRQAPAGFVYALKASRFLTHLKKLKDPEEPLQRLLERARLLGPHLGPVLYQLPPRWRCDLGRLRRFVSLLPTDLTHVFEFREASWFNEEVRGLLAEAGLGFCIHDLRGFRCPAWVTGPAAYVRFHGPTEAAYAGRYDLGHLRHWAEQIRHLHRAGRAVYAYFNNDDRGYAVTNALELRGMLAEASAGREGER